jgi:hypothetical protein
VIAGTPVECCGFFIWRFVLVLKFAAGPFRKKNRISLVNDIIQLTAARFIIQKNDAGMVTRYTSV